MLRDENRSFLTRKGRGFLRSSKSRAQKHYDKQINGQRMGGNKVAGVD
jgi:hypothetical protein